MENHQRLPTQSPTLALLELSLRFQHRDYPQPVAAVVDDVLPLLTTEPVKRPVVRIISEDVDKPHSWSRRRLYKVYADNLRILQRIVESQREWQRRDQADDNGRTCNPSLPAFHRFISDATVAEPEAACQRYRVSARRNAR